jgi:hypothetical protein
VTAVSGAVTLNGPAVEVTFTNIWSEATPPPPERLSRTVARNCMERLVTGSDSLTGTSGGVLSQFRMYCSCGNVRDGLGSVSGS